MNRLMYAAGACSAAIAAALTFSAGALAEPDDAAPAVDGTASEGPSAADQVAALRAEGKSVQVVGSDDGMLQNCDVVNTTEGEAANTVMVEVECGLNYP
jgi:hypothetical protein